jgi:hypothetical protein
MKMPDPIMDPTTRAVASRREIARTNSTRCGWTGVVVMRVIT